MESINLMNLLNNIIDIADFCIKNNYKFSVMPYATEDTKFLDIFIRNNNTKTIIIIATYQENIYSLNSYVSLNHSYPFITDTEYLTLEQVEQVITTELA